MNVEMNNWWGNSRVAAGVLTQKALNDAWTQLLAKGIVPGSPRDAVKLLGWKDIEWDLALDDAVAAVRAR